MKGHGSRVPGMILGHLIAGVVLVAICGASMASDIVESYSKIGGMALRDSCSFGGAACSLGDLDGNGVEDLAAGLPADDDGGADRGAVWVFLMSSTGIVRTHQKISDTEGSFAGVLDDYDYFGSSVCPLGDLDGDGVGDMAVGAAGDDDGGADRGAVWVLFMKANGTVRAYQKISDTAGGFTGVLDNGDGFGGSACSPADLDNDGVEDLVVGARADDDGGADRGAVWVLFMNTNGTVRAHQKISDTTGSFTGVLDDYDGFGSSVCSLTDLDADGVEDLIAGADADDDGGADRGAVWVLLMNANGTVKTHQKISDTEGGFTGVLEDTDRFGCSAGAIGDLDDDGVEDLAVGALRDDDGGADRGAVWVLFMNSDGTVRVHQKVSDTAGGFAGTLDDTDYFGCSVCAAGDLDGDGVEDLAVGALLDDDRGTDCGAVWVLFMNSDGTAGTHQKISSIEGGFIALDPDDRFAWSAGGVGDLDDDGIQDLAGGAFYDDDGGFNRGAVWIFFMNSDGTAKAHQKISDLEGGFTGVLDDDDRFGTSVCSLGDLDNDGIEDLGVGAMTDSDGGIARGAVWVLFMNADGTVKAHQKISDTEGGFTGILNDQDRFGTSVCALGDLDGDQVVDMAVGARADSDGGRARGAVWILFMNSDGTVKAHQKISDTQGNFTAVLDDQDFFGFAVTPLGCLDGDGTEDVAVGAYWDDDGGSNRGAVYVLFLNPDGTVKSHQKISSTDGGFTGVLDDGDCFGTCVWILNDLNADGVDELAVGGSGDDDGGLNRGALWVLLMNADGTVKDHRKISSTEGGFTGVLHNQDSFGWSVCSLGDLDANGVEDVAVGAVYDDAGGLDGGALWVLFLGDDITAAVPGQPPAAPAYLQVSPNPCRGSAHIAFGLDREQTVTVAVYDVRGRLVRTLIDHPTGPGQYSQGWDTRDDRGTAVGSGIYFCRLAVDDNVLTTKILLLK